MVTNSYKLLVKTTQKSLAIYLSLWLIFGPVFSNRSYALTSGPSQPEVQTFSPVDATNMVDLASGDFSYNIPLIDVGGYPINMSYSSNVSMDSESSWVGLGWNINPGVINRSMRGLPDDYNGDEVKKEYNVKAKLGGGINVAASFGEGLGWPISLQFGIGIHYNNYTGFNISQSVNANLEFSTQASGTKNTSVMGLGLGLSTDSDGGLNINPSLSLSDQDESKTKTNSISLGFGFNSRGGFQSFHANVSQRVKNSNASKSSSEEDQEEKKVIWKGNKGSRTSNGTSITMMPNTAVPSVSMPMMNEALTFNAKIGPEIFGADIPQLSVTGYFTANHLYNDNRTLNAYGYLYSQNGTEKSALHDFNRESDAGYVRGVPNLPVTNYTYDVFSAVGQGMSGTFRPFRNDVGAVYDPNVWNLSLDGNLGLEFGGGSAVEVGGEVNVNVATSSSKWWKSNNDAFQSFKFTEKGGNNSDYENVYFKQVGEYNVDENSDFYADYGGEDPFNIELEGSVSNAKARNNIKVKNGSSKNVYDIGTKKNVRAKRNQLFSYLTKKEVGSLGLENITANNAKSHHIGEVTVTKTDGSRYVYGLPAYNNFQKDVMFNVAGNTVDSDNKHVSYSPGVDNTLSNDKGIDNMYSNKELDPYAHAYMLTAVLTPDYVDYDDVRGPSKGDLGNYVKFDYGSTPDIENYKWRAPYLEGKANFIEGKKSDNSDDKGSYVYGEKDIWYLDKIETKTHVAVFFKSERLDAIEVNSENGGKGANAMHKLDSIKLFTVEEYDKYLTTPSSATPIKTVHFDYSYKMCKDVENNDGVGNEGGKLTLDKVSFSYGNSQKSRLNGYTFVYGDIDDDGATDLDANPDYDTRHYDMWGNYKKEGSISNTEFPYLDQGAPTNGTFGINQNDVYAHAWKLTGINLPSGGVINIDYEADQYAYVQNKKAHEFMNVIGASTVAPGSISGLDNRLIDANGTVGNADPRLFLAVELRESITTGIDFKNKYLKYLKKDANGDYLMYFHFLMDFNGVEEYVGGYASIKNWGKIDANHAWIELNAVCEENKDNCNTESHPITKAAWQYVRTQNPRLAFSQQIDDNQSQTSFVEAIAGSNFFSSIKAMFEGPNGEMRHKDLGNQFNVDKSWVRLVSPTAKYGGGSRVKRVTVNDKWSDMLGGTNGHQNSEYGQEYTYTMDDGTSSGVATFEPLSSRENPWIEPVYFDVDKFLVPDDRYMIEAPYGKSFFPAPQVTYRKVTVQSIDKDFTKSSTNYSTSKHRAGRQVSNFYTAYDFPVIVDQTPLEQEVNTSSPIMKIFKFNIKENITVSQGYSIVLNDMNGKLRSQYTYGEFDNQIVSGMEYEYSVEDKEVQNSYIPKDNNSETLTISGLQNNLPTVDDDGNIENKEIGVEYDIINDFRQDRSESYSIGGSLNLNTMLAGFIPIPIPGIFANTAREVRRYRAAVSTKVVKKYGILKKATAIKDQARVETENLLWDKETGNVLLTRTTNEYHDDIFEFNFPAHWSYKSMSGAYKNIGYENKNASCSAAGIFNVGAGNAEKFHPGDEVKIVFKDGGTEAFKKAWVLKINSGSEIVVIDKDGVLVDATYLTAINNYFGSTIFTSLPSINFKVIRSGYRNIPAKSVGSIVMLENPDNDDLIENDDFISSPTNKIMAANVTEYSEIWGMNLGDVSTIASTQTECGPTDILLQILDGTGYGNRNITDPCFRIYDDISDSIDFVNQQGVHNYFTQNYSNVEIKQPIEVYSPDQYTVVLVGTLSNGEPVEIIIKIICEGGYLWDCYEVPVYTTEYCDLAPGSNINPYYQNVLGVWRPLRSWLKLGDRESAQMENVNTGTGVAENTVDKRRQGYYEDFEYFWEYNPGSSGKWNPHPDTDNDGTDDWTWTSMVTQYVGYDQDGMERENRNALYQYSSVVYGYNNKKPIGVASNASKRQIGFDGFEDYNFYTEVDCDRRHFAFEDHATAVTDEESHTGKYSIKIPFYGKNISMNRMLKTYENPEYDPYDPGGTPNNYTLQEVQDIGRFGPETYDRAAYEKEWETNQNIVINEEDQQYVLSYWVKMDGDFSEEFDVWALYEAWYNDNGAAEYDKVVPVISSNNATITILNAKMTELIDGWMLKQYVFEIEGMSDQANNTDITVSIFNNATDPDHSAFVDDIRIAPYNSVFKTYVYHPTTMRLVAELDQNNFATFYEYDAEGRLERVKKETERGIMTIKEVRQHTNQPAN